jgi:AcrR family transcriptional regulator
MKKQVNRHQAAAEKARAKILKAARKLFIAKGFSGTSIGSIAKLAKINQSLMYHYFESKEDLWREVKVEIIAASLGTNNLNKAPPIHSIDELLDHLFVQRFAVYLKNPDLVRMLMWQSLEDHSHSIFGTSEGWLKSWLKAIEELQKNKKISEYFTPHEILLWINGLVLAPFVSLPFGKPSTEAEAYSQKMVGELKERLS